MTRLRRALAQYAHIAADTADLEAIADLQPARITTNPTLILRAARDVRYAHIARAAIHARGLPSPLGEVSDAPLRMAIAFGTRILGLVPGEISTQLAPNLSFDADKTERQAHHLIACYGQAGIPADRVLVKIAATWEGIQAAARLERSGIRCNLTLLFGFTQALACADAGVTMVAPYVGRINDWHQQHHTAAAVQPAADPGVREVLRICHVYRQRGYRTQVMAASFRHPAQILALAGCDVRTISPALLRQLEANENIEAVPTTGTPEALRPAQPCDEACFRWALNEDALATDKLAEGLRSFHLDWQATQALATQWRDD